MIEWLESTGTEIIQAFAAIFELLDQPIIQAAPDVHESLLEVIIEWTGLIDLYSVTWMELILEMVPVAIILGIMGAIWKAIPLV